MKKTLLTSVLFCCLIFVSASSGAPPPFCHYYDADGTADGEVFVIGYSYEFGMIMQGELPCLSPVVVAAHPPVMGITFKTVSTSSDGTVAAAVGYQAFMLVHGKWLDIKETLINLSGYAGNNPGGYFFTGCAVDKDGSKIIIAGPGPSYTGLVWEYRVDTETWTVTSTPYEFSSFDAVGTEVFCFSLGQLMIGREMGGYTLWEEYSYAPATGPGSHLYTGLGDIRIVTYSRAFHYEFPDWMEYLLPVSGAMSDIEGDFITGYFGIYHWDGIQWNLDYETPYAHEFWAVTEAGGEYYSFGEGNAVAWYDGSEWQDITDTIEDCIGGPTPTPPPTWFPTLPPPTATPILTATPVPTNTPVPPTATPLPTNTPLPPPTSTPLPPTMTPLPTDTPVSTPTAIPPTDTPIPPTATPTEDGHKKPKPTKKPHPQKG